MEHQQDETFISRCLSETLDGLNDGMSHFSGPSRTAVIYCISRDGEMMICDPQNLLQEHKPKLDALFVQNDSWRTKVPLQADRSKFNQIHPLKDPELTGVISYGGCSGSVFFQMWFTDHHPDLCSTGPTLRWLEHAVWRFSHDMANDKELYTGISGSFLREYAVHAVHDHIIDEMNIHLGWDSQVRIYPVLDAVLGISRTREEGDWPVGELVIIDPQLLEKILFVARFIKEERPQLENFKHVRKLLLTVEGSDYKLVSDGKSILGICDNIMPHFFICADFRGRHGYLKINREKICSFSEGHFSSTTRRAKLVQVEEALLESSLHPQARDNIFRIVASLAHHAQQKKHGCTLVIDLNPDPVTISGQSLDPPLDLRQPNFLALSKALAKVDGALHIGADQHLHGFACLLDGRTIPGEDRARGARYNSALRFTAEHNNIIVVVVSSDRPVAVIQEGVEISGICQWKPEHSCIFATEPLNLWCSRS
ncbi:DNA integrity scanning protein DisA nucleotide-binding domain protein [Desulfolithobacter sp.]